MDKYFVNTYERDFSLDDGEVHIAIMRKSKCKYLKSDTLVLDFGIYDKNNTKLINTLNRYCRILNILFP